MAERGERLPGAPDDDGPERVVLHVDMDCFYAACERLREPELVGEPLVVGMGYEPGEGHGAVATASYEAREYGVESAQAITQALDRLPRKADEPENPEAGYYRPVDLEFYQEVAAEVKTILHDLADTVREVSIDEAYLDVTDRTNWEVAEGFARHVKGRIESEVGVTASVGVAPNMSTAKIASDHEKPDGLVVVPPGEVREFLAPLPVEEVHGVGPVTAGDLRELDVETAGDLAEADPTDLADRFGDRGVELHQRARGEDDREVTPTGRPKSLSRESSFGDPTGDDEEKRRRVRTLAEAVAERARGKDVLYRTIGIKVVEPPFDVNTRERSLPGPVDDPALVEEVALDLLDEFAGDRVRKVGVRVSNLSFADADQSSLDGWDGGEDEVAAAPDAGAPADGSTRSSDDSARQSAGPAAGGRGGGRRAAGEPSLSSFAGEERSPADESAAGEESFTGETDSADADGTDDPQSSLAEATAAATTTQSESHDGDTPTEDSGGGGSTHEFPLWGQTTLYDFC